jgi:AbrB family looped-hinge helix DNA binding protein
MATVKTLAKGQIVIPAEFRRRHGIKPGTEMQLLEYGDVLYLIPPVDDPVEAASGILPLKPSLTEKLLRERRKDFR